MLGQFHRRWDCWYLIASHKFSILERRRVVIVC
ncbi:hypothetical protein TGAM01_v209099 [Trichoderma gamsii]|uniref:Uncharacterized protein n=1 Tax=Trichoderma gamsii TaxID=398673 RepID=A0A2P4ZCK3_9HYPO|nr:hypothetical protein TGAM01_v209099 [Trichoderma gamsii]PON22029.1 hypothetical protein TGAM01_v209099 [Trichoderma gamsii]